MLDLVFPPHCVGCGKVGLSWCQHCLQELSQQPLQPHLRELPPMSGIIATAPHEGKLQEAIHALKYYGVTELATPLAQRLFTCLQATNWTYDTIIPVPLYITRLRERGYNQSQIIGLKLAEALNMPLVPTALERQRQTTSQVGLSREERAKNVDGAFRAASNMVTGRRILLIDDVLTTGATLLACAAALFDAGAIAVYGITVTAARY